MDLERLNEEVRTRVYLSYFSNARTRIDEQHRRIVFLQRLKDEEGGDPHFRINAKQVFGDPKAYEKLMPWIETLMEIAKGREGVTDDRRTIGELVEELLEDERHRIAKLEHGLNQIRAGFAATGNSPLSLEAFTIAFPVEWSADGKSFPWHETQGHDREPLRQDPGESKPRVEVTILLCSVCRQLTRLR